MICLSSAHLNSDMGTIRCTHSLLRWLINRKMQPKVISCNGSCAVVDDLSFVGIDNKLLHTLDLSSRLITNDGLRMIARGCSQLKDIARRDCDKISDTGLLALAVNLPGMTSIDLYLTYSMGWCHCYCRTLSCSNEDLFICGLPKYFRFSRAK